MRAADEFLALAELAVGLAGFSGVVVAFGYHGRLETLDRMRFIALLTVAMGAALFAFVPFLFHHAGANEATTWRGSSLLFLTAGIAYAVVVAPPLRRAALSSGAPVPGWMRSGMLALSVLNFALQLSNAAGWPAAPGPFPFLAGLVIWLCFAALFFAFLVLLRPEDRECR